MKRLIIVAVVLGLVLGAWGICFCLTRSAWLSDATKVQQYGVFGDSFGSVNALFSGLAFAGVVIALLFQAHDSRQQREEFRLQARISACAAIIEAERTLSEYYVEAIDSGAPPPPISGLPNATWADMVSHSRVRILEMSAQLETTRQELMRFHT